MELRVVLDSSMNSSRRSMKASCSSGVSMEEVMSAGPTIGRVHRSVVRYFMPSKIILPLYLTAHFLMSNLTVHPASVSSQIPKREAIDNSGTMCPTRVVGRPGIMMSHMCVDITRRPTANSTLSGHVVFCLLWTSVPSMTKIWVAPESVIASFDALALVAYAQLGCCLGANKENADWRLVVIEPFKTFDVTTGQR